MQLSKRCERLTAQKSEEEVELQKSFVSLSEEMISLKKIYANVVSGKYMLEEERKSMFLAMEEANRRASVAETLLGQSKTLEEEHDKVELMLLLKEISKCIAFSWLENASVVEVLCSKTSFTKLHEHKATSSANALFSKLFRMTFILLVVDLFMHWVLLRIVWH